MKSGRVGLELERESVCVSVYIDEAFRIRTPMNAVIALTDLLLQERSSLNIEQIEHLEVIQTSGSHLLTVGVCKVNPDAC